MVQLDPAFTWPLSLSGGYSIPRFMIWHKWDDIQVSLIRESEIATVFLSYRRQLHLNCGKRNLEEPRPPPAGRRFHPGNLVLGTLIYNDTPKQAKKPKEVKCFYLLLASDEQLQVSTIVLLYEVRVACAYLKLILIICLPNCGWSGAHTHVGWVSPSLFVGLSAAPFCCVSVYYNHYP